MEYFAAGSTTVYAYLQSGITKNDFFVVFAQVVEAVKKIERNSLNINNLLLDTRYCFFNQITKEVNFLYQPIFNCTNQTNIFTFMYDMASATVLTLEENNGFLNELVNYIRGMQTYSSDAMEAYIVKVYPQVYKQVQRQKAGQSQALKHTGWNYYEEKYNTKVADNDDKPAGEDTSLLDEQDDEYDNYDDTDLLFEDGGDEGTTVLTEGEGTALLIDNMPSYPYLIRINTYEKVNINKPVFRIGKEKSYVDYFVASNNAVSRIHADIITRDNHYYIKDNNSTNHTFVNGTMVPLNQMAEIFDGDSLMLANEPFEFHVE